MHSVAQRPRSAHPADVAQLVEHHLAKVDVAGSSPVVRSRADHAVPTAQRDRHAPVAQRTERLTSDQLAGGSTPSRRSHGSPCRERGREAHRRACAGYSIVDGAPFERTRSHQGPLAQPGLERFPVTEEAAGSNPVGVASGPVDAHHRASTTRAGVIHLLRATDRLGVLGNRQPESFWCS